MKIEPVVIKDADANVYVGFIKQFPGISAQADTLEELAEKLDRYFRIFIEKKVNSQVVINEDEVLSM